MLATEFGSRAGYKDANEAVSPMDDEVLCVKAKVFLFQVLISLFYLNYSSFPSPYLL